VSDTQVLNEIPVLTEVLETGDPARVRDAVAATQHVAEQVQNRLTQYLTGPGREAIEARCRAALDDHNAWLVSQITREVALALETEVMNWVRDALDAEHGRT
jgi:hypothetical protein